MHYPFLFIPIGILVGTISGFIGIGGGIILMPVLLLSGFDPAMAVSTSLMFTLGTSLSGAITHTRIHNVNWIIAVVIGSAGALFSQVSNRIVMLISGRYDWLLNVWLILLLGYFAWSLFNDRKRKRYPPLFGNRLIAALLIGVIVGLLSALLGIGGGFIIVPLLISWIGFDSRNAVGTSLAAIILVSLGGIAGYGMQMELNYLAGIYLIIGAFIGSPFGAKMTSHYRSEEITQRLGVLYLFVLASILVDLIASFTLPRLEWLSLSILLVFLGCMLYDFYSHRHQSQIDV